MVNDINFDIKMASLGFYIPDFSAKVRDVLVTGYP
jgi:hypothetical protein